MLTSASKKALAATIRDLRARLLRALADEAHRRYRLAVSPEAARLEAQPAALRRRLEAWLDEHTRAAHPNPRSDTRATRARLFDEAVEAAAATFLNRLVVLKCLEAARLIRPTLVTGGINSPAVRDFREFAPALFLDDENQGYAWLLAQAFDEVAVDLPALFGEVGLSGLFQVPPEMLRATVEALNQPELDEAWTDDTTLGWTYQYWNDPRREALDAKIKDGGKLEAHEIAPKTQMFTERYMVEWLLQNTLGLQWLALCQHHGWTADCAHPQGVLDTLEARRKDWRARRDQGEVGPEQEMPFTPDGLEARWRYYVPQSVPQGMVEAIPRSVRQWKVLDPACGSGHFLVHAFGLLTALYEEEARHRGETWSRPDIAASILEHNLHGVDLDPRAVQIAAAALLLAARRYAPEVVPRRLNLVATAFDLGRLHEGDPSLVHLLNALWEAGKVPPAAVKAVVKALAGIDAYGTLLKVDRTLEDALRETEKVANPTQGSLLGGDGEARVTHAAGRAQVDLVALLEQLLARETRRDDLGLRLDGEQLSAGVRFARIVREGQYDLVVGNPPYQGTGKMADAAYVAKHYPYGKADLYAAFLQRGLELAKPQGLSAMVTMQGWMFLSQYAALREQIIGGNSIRSLCDLMWCGFDSMRHATVAMFVMSRGSSEDVASVALMPSDRTEREESNAAFRRKCAAVLAHVGRYEFTPASFDVVEGKPLVYWWSEDLLRAYRDAPKMGDISPAHAGLSTQNNQRFLRQSWELPLSRMLLSRSDVESPPHSDWVPYIKGASGAEWMEPMQDVIRWQFDGMELRVWIDDYKSRIQGQYIKNERDYFHLGVAFAAIGSGFSARAHRYASVFGHMGASVFPGADMRSRVLCMMQSTRAREVVESLNPTIHFGSADVNRLPLFEIEDADTIVATLDAAFTEHEAARETSVEFRRPGPSPWSYAQSWAQAAVDRPARTPLPPYAPTYDPPTPVDALSFAFGIALGRFAPDGTGLLDTAPDTALPGGILFLQCTGGKDSLDHPACAPLHAAWAARSPGFAADTELRAWLARSFFAEHKDRYDNRPIWWPLSSTKKTFVAWVALHRLSSRTLPELLSDHLVPLRRTLEGMRDDQNAARSVGDKKARAQAERVWTELSKHLTELQEFVSRVEQCADRGPPAGEVGSPRERDAVYDPVLDDGVMVNTSALYPLLDPQWKDPRKWWKELSTAEGRKDYDWSKLAARYFPGRVAAKCASDPSLAVAHGCFWRLHPARAYAWELRLQHDLRPDFVLDEADAAGLRAAFLRERATEAAEIRAKETKRRERKAAKGGEAEGDGDGEAELPLGE